jgi:hypothetical protein
MFPERTTELTHEQHASSDRGPAQAPSVDGRRIQAIVIVSGERTLAQVSA